MRIVVLKNDLTSAANTKFNIIKPLPTELFITDECIRIWRDKIKNIEKPRHLPSFTAPSGNRYYLYDIGSSGIVCYKGDPDYSYGYNTETRTECDVNFIHKYFQIILLLKGNQLITKTLCH